MTQSIRRAPRPRNEPQMPFDRPQRVVTLNEATKIVAFLGGLFALISGIVRVTGSTATRIDAYVIRRSTAVAIDIATKTAQQVVHDSLDVHRRTEHRRRPHSRHAQ